MKTTKWFVLGIVAIGLLAVSALAPTPAGAQTPPPPPGQALKRVASNFTAFDGSVVVIDEDTSTGGQEIYDQTVKTPAGANVMYVTLQATSFLDICDDVGVAVECAVDGVACNSGFDTDQDLDFLPAGWIEVTGNSFSEYTSAWMPISFTWCTPFQKTKKNLHVVELFGAVDEDEAGCVQLLQGVAVHVDVNKFNKANTDLGNACQSYPNPSPTS
jgi:hypothetical protein